MVGLYKIYVLVVFIISTLIEVQIIMCSFSCGTNIKGVAKYMFLTQI